MQPLLECVVDVDLALATDDDDTTSTATATSVSLDDPLTPRVVWVGGGAVCVTYLSSGNGFASSMVTLVSLPIFSLYCFWAFSMAPLRTP